MVALAADYSWVHPVWALIIKFLLFLGGGYALATAVRSAKPPTSTLEEPLQVPGFHVAREALFAIGFLLVALLVSEPFLAPEGAAPAMPFRLRVPAMAGAAIASRSQPQLHRSLRINQNFNTHAVVLRAARAVVEHRASWKLAEVAAGNALARVSN